MTDDRGPDPRFRAWLAGQAPDDPPAGLLPEVMRRIDASGQQRGWLPAWSVHPALAAVATMVVVAVAVGVGLVLSDLAPDSGPAASVSVSGSSSEPSRSPSPVALDPVVVARIALPHAGAQTVFEDQLAVSQDRIWIVAHEGGTGSYLVGIDTTTNAVIADIPIDPAGIAAGDAGVWMVTPWNVAPGPETIELLAVDEAAGEPRIRGRYPAVTAFAVGLGHVWLLDEAIAKVDPATGDVLATSESGDIHISVECGSVWTWGVPAQPSDTTSQLIVSRIDPETGEHLESFAVPATTRPSIFEIEGRCWLQDHNTLLEIEPGRGIVATVEVPPVGTLQIAGETLWSVRAANVIHRVDPTTGEAVGPMWQLPEDDLHENPRGTPDWRLLSADGSLWVLGAEWLVRYDIPTGELVPQPTPAPTAALTPTPAPSAPVIPPEPSNPILGGQPVTDRDLDNSFTLVLRSDQDRYRAGQPIAVQATLAFTGNADRVVAWGSGSGIVTFGVETADGSIRIDPAGTSDCAETEIAAARPMVIPFAKSGGYGYDDPLAPFYQAYFRDPDLRLPAGTWTIRAYAFFSTGIGCEGDRHQLETSLTLVVEP